MNKERKDKPNEIFSIHKSVVYTTLLISLIFKAKKNSKNKHITSNKENERKKIQKIISFV